MDPDNIFCNQKFTFIQINIENGVTQSCCNLANEDKPTYAEITNSNFFNYPAIQRDRRLILDGTWPAGCHKCKDMEDSGHKSVRQLKNYNINENITASLDQVPETINLVLGNRCGMSCVYCCKKFSSSWLSDIVTRGPYQVDWPDRYTAHQFDLLDFTKRSKPRPYKTEVLKNLESWLQDSKPPKNLVISGGEPLIHESFTALVSIAVESNLTVYIHTGLGLPSSNLRRIMSSFLSLENVFFIVSAESVSELYEFNRAGNTYENFKNNLDILSDLGINYTFNCVISSTTVFGLPEFIETFPDRKCKYSILSDPSFLSVSVLDPATKTKVVDLVPTLEYSYMLQTTATQAQKVAAGEFLREFAARKRLSLSVLPENFRKWLSI